MPDQLLTKEVGRTDGEAPEHGRVKVNPVARITARHARCTLWALQLEQI